MALNNDFGLFSVHAPRLEDAGLEDAALPAHAIQEAFNRAANALQTSPWRLRSNSAGVVRTGDESADSPSNDFCEPGKFTKFAAASGEKEGCVESKAGGRVVEEGPDLIVGPDVGLYGSDKVEFGKEGGGPKLGDKGCVEGLDGDRGEDKDAEKEMEDGPILVLA